MKTTIRLAAIIAIAITAISCAKDKAPTEPIEFVYAKLNFNGDVTIKPLDTKASNSKESFESGDLLLLNVYRYNDDSFDDQQLASVQAGVYTDISNIVIPLIKGGHYQIIASVVKDASSSASWLDFPYPASTNKLVENKVAHLFSMMLNGKYVKNYKSYRGGQRITANSDINLNLKMVINYIGITLNYNDVKGDVLVFCDITGHSPMDINAYTVVSSGKTDLMKFSELENSGNGDNGRCGTYTEQCITTGDGAMYDPEYQRGFDIRIARSLNKKISYLNVINVNAKAGDNIIINIEEGDFTGYNGELSLEFSDNSKMKDVYYN